MVFNCIFDINIYLYNKIKLDIYVIVDVQGVCSIVMED